MMNVRSTVRRPIAAAAATAVLAASAAAAGVAATSTHPGQFVGKVIGIRAFVAVVVANGRVRAYVCDGDGHTIHLYAWFTGRGTGSFDLTGGPVADSHPDRLTCTVQGGAVVGRFTDASGKSFSYRAGPDTGRAGMFGAEGKLGGKRVTGGGWIVLADGQERGGILRPRTLTPIPIPNPSISSGSTVSVSGGTLTAQRITTP
jgi:hypothetical protein